MKKNIYFIFVSTFLTITNVTAQKLSTDMFPNSRIHEDFNINSDNWPTITSTDNYFIFDKGDYLLSRTNTESEYAILTANGDAFQDFAIKTSIRIGPSDNPSSNLGLILKAQKDGKGAVIIEFNRDKKYRIKQLSGYYYNSITGKEAEDGWVKSSKLKSGDDANTIEIRTQNNIYELYINSKYETTFFLNDYLSGSVGIIIGPETKARIEYFYLNTLTENISEAEKNNIKINNLNSEKLEKEIAELKIELTEKNTLLEREKEENEKKINTLNSNLEIVKENLKVVKEHNNTLLETKKTLENKLANINSSNTASINTIQAELNAKNSQLELANSNISALNLEITLLKEKLTVISDLKNKITLQESKLNNAKRDVEDVTTINAEKIKLLNSKITVLENEKSKLNNALSLEKSTNKKTKNELTATIKGLNSEIKTLKDNLNNEKSKVSTSTKNLSDISRVNQKEINSLNAKISLLNNKVTNLEKDNNKLSNGLKSEKKTGAKEVQDLQIEIKDLKKTLTQQIVELKVLSKQKNKLQSEIANINNFKNEAKQKEEELVKKNNALNQELAKNNQKMIAFTDSVIAVNNRYEKLKSFMVSQGIIKNGGIKNINPIKTKVEENLEGKEFYSVQLGAFMSPVPNSKFPNANDIYNVKNEDDIFIYLSGEYKNLNDAINEKNKLINKGGSSLYVVKVIDRRKVIIVE